MNRLSRLGRVIANKRKAAIFLIPTVPLLGHYLTIAHTSHIRRMYPLPKKLQSRVFYRESLLVTNIFTFPVRIYIVAPDKTERILS